MGPFRMRFFATFVAAVVASGYLHELGHAVVAWSMGLAAVPTPLKAYLLVDRVEWGRQIWIALGGVVGSAVGVAAAATWYATGDRRSGDPILAGMLVMPWAYTLRFGLVGRGHDGLEWQEAQSALGTSPTGHAVDYLFAVLALGGGAVWILRRRTRLSRYSLLEALGLLVSGFVVLGLLQSGNNAVFDPIFPRTETLNVPTELRSQ